LSDSVWVTYAEAAERLGISVEGVRLKVKRDQKLGKDAKLRVRRDNSGRMLLAWDEALLGQRGVTRGAQHNGEDVGPIGAVDAGAIEALTKLSAQQHTAHVAALAQQRADHKAELERMQAAHAAELERLIEERAQLQNELQEARAEANHAKADQVHMARDVAGMFDELKALADRHAELHADRARLEADVARLTTDLEQARRPWWWRLVGR
jgi:hypothetical protein